MATYSSRFSGAGEFPNQPVQRLLDPVVRFLRVEASSGVLLLTTTIVALVLANSPWAGEFLAFWKTPVGVRWGDWSVEHSLQHWINDGLMVLFFFVIGLELKRELVFGELSNPRQAIMPAMAAVGGMLFPAGIYLALQSGSEASAGWGVPMATDIAFVVGCLALVGSRVPHGLRVMLLSLAIIDDLGAILVIAIGYTQHLHFGSLGLGLAGVVLCTVLARLGVRSIPIYVVLGVAIWFAVHESGVHATLAGVLIGLVTPARSWIDPGQAGKIVRHVGEFFTGEAELPPHERVAAVRYASRAGSEAISPVERLETALHPWVAFVILPLFALANAGVPIRLASFTDSVAVAVFLGLVVGKPVGVLLLSWLAARLGLAQLPTGVTWTMVAAGGMLSGIGFTMAIFISNLAFRNQPAVLDVAKVGVLAASFVSAAVAMSILCSLSPRSTATPDSTPADPT